MNEVQALKHRLSETLKAKQLGAALAALAQLERHEPDEPDWPRRSARLLHARNDPAGELRALRRALELQVDHGRVLDAIASCKSILELEPEDEQTLQTLDLLYMEGPRQDGSSSAQDDGLYGSDPGTTADACDGGGSCAGTPYVCTPGTCEATSLPDGDGGCTVTYSDAGVLCDDGDPGTAGDACDGGGSCAGRSAGSATRC